MNKTLLGMRRFFSRFRRSEPKIADPALPTGLRVYAIGDLHGRADLLDEMLESITRHDRAAEPAQERRVVFLGDLIDRGPQSRDILDRLASPPLLPGFSTTVLMGNHERLMIDFLETPAVGRLWLANGGLPTLVSYGLSPPLGTATPERLADLRTALAAALPPAHLAFLKGLPLSLCLGDYLFVHAGIRPRRPLDEQTPQDMLWIAAPFLTSPQPMEGRVVVHGHHISAEPDQRPGRIGIDTGGYHSGVLTCLVLEADRRAFLQTAPDSVRRAAHRSR